MSQPTWYGKFNSPYYTASHVEFRAKVRAFVEAEIMPFTHEWDESKSLPMDLYKKTYAAGILPGVVGAPWAGGMGEQLAVKPPANFDYFHELIILDEFGRCGSGGVLWGLLEGIHIGLPPVLNFGNAGLRERVGLPVLRGEGVICLCITEPYAGSDVANIRATAKKSPCGGARRLPARHVTRYIVFRCRPLSFATWCTGARHVIQHIVYRCSPRHPPHSVLVLAPSSATLCTGARHVTHHIVHQCWPRRPPHSVGTDAHRVIHLVVYWCSPRHPRRFQPSSVGLNVIL